MKNVHSESDHSRIERLAKTTKATLEQDKLNLLKKNYPQIFDCSECGNIFPTNKEYLSHIKRCHTTATQNTKSEVSEESLTLEEFMEVTKLHDEAMAPTEEEVDWMLLVTIKEERKSLKSKYL